MLNLHLNKRHSSVSSNNNTNITKKKKKIKNPASESKFKSSLKCLWKNNKIYFKLIVYFFVFFHYYFAYSTM